MVKKTDYSLGINWLKDQHFTNYSHTFKVAEGVANAKGRKIVKSGTIYPANDATAIGIVFSDVDVTDGDNVGALMVHGNVLKGRLAAINGAEVSAAAITALEAKGIYFYSDNVVA